MKPKYLREACEEAGLECWYTATHGQVVGVRNDKGSTIWRLPEKDPALTAYVASLLIAKTWHVSGLDWLNMYEAGASDSRERAVDIAIGAIMVELGEWSKEMMREALA